MVNIGQEVQRVGHEDDSFALSLEAEDSVVEKCFTNMGIDCRKAIIEKLV